MPSGVCCSHVHAACVPGGEPQLVIDVTRGPIRVVDGQYDAVPPITLREPLRIVGQLQAPASASLGGDDAQVH